MNLRLKTFQLLISRVSNYCDLKKNGSVNVFANYARQFCSQTETKEHFPRYNSINIQMLSQNLHSQIFGNQNVSAMDAKLLEDVILHLSKHNLWEAKTTTLPEVSFQLPKLFNSNVIDHFEFIASRLLSDYKNLLNELLMSEFPPIPQKWEFLDGWVQYDSQGNYKKVVSPEESSLVLDVEVCMQDGNFPTIATAVSSKYWYLWCSKRLIDDSFSWSKDPCLSDLIPLEPGNISQNELSPKLIVGHNVAFDRTFIKEQYSLESTKTMFLDSMSLHMCVSGLTGMQRAMSLANKKKPDPKTPNYFTVMGWSDISSLNNLADVYSLYCEDKEPLQKSEREIFVSGSLLDVKKNFQALATYCAKDSSACFRILKKIMPMFFERFPHPATLYGLLEMSTAYLPVNKNWQKYLQEAQSTYDDLQKELKLSLMHLANDACSLLHDQHYKKDPWLWNLDWSIQELKFRKAVEEKSEKKKRKRKGNDVEALKSENLQEKQSCLKEDEEIHSQMSPIIQEIYKSASSLRKVRPFLPGYPAWYRELCDKNGTNNPDWEPGPILLSTQMRCVPKLMRLTWDGYPLHYDAKYGWGYLIPDSESNQPLNIVSEEGFPIKSLLSLLHTTHQKVPVSEHLPDDDLYWSKIQEPKDEDVSSYWNVIFSNNPALKKVSSAKHHGIGPHDIGIKGCLFYCLPHKDGPNHRVGNPLSKDFLPKVEDGTLRTWGGKGVADRALLLSKMLSYWKNAHGRIISQMVVWFSPAELPPSIKHDADYDENNSYGAILPRLVTAGTVTRRAVEPTWLTASNAYADRVGSELKSMIQAPPGYHFVGADVDSQELWLAALFGDSHFAKCHGSTAFGWMTLQGKKSAGTDMHSRTAASVGIGRDQAKVLNYARIYGAGKTFAQRLLMQFNHRLTPEEAKQKVNKMYSETKGNQRAVLSEDEIESNGFVFTPGTHRRIWVGGSESYMFNKLEDIALSKTPSTPALGCRISRALEPRAVDRNFMTSRVNWVVQSSAVDFLHLMLVCMRWLFKEYNIRGRFSICIHDEVRYLVKSEDRYRAALALQITNLLTRSFFTAQVGIHDLPQSVAFFSSVDIDKVLRKEVTMDSKTPSNPHGLHQGYGISTGVAMDINDILKVTEGKLT